MEFLDLAPPDAVPDAAGGAAGATPALSELEQPPTAWLLAASALRAAQRSAAIRRRWGATPFLRLLRHEQPHVRWVGVEGVALHFQLVRHVFRGIPCGLAARCRHACCERQASVRIESMLPTCWMPRPRNNLVAGWLGASICSPNRTPDFDSASMHDPAKAWTSCVGVSSSLALHPQSDAASDRLRRRVLTPEQSLSAVLRWRRDDEAVAAEQAAMWLGAGAGEAGRPHDAMATEEEAGSAVDAQPAPPQGAQGSVH